MMKRSKKERLEISTKLWENRDNNKNPDQRNGPKILRDSLGKFITETENNSASKEIVQIHSNPSESNQRESLFLNFQPLNISNLPILDQPSGTLTEENNSPNPEKDSVQEISNDNNLMETEDSIENTPLPAVDSGENQIDSRDQSEPKLTTDMVLIHSDTIKSETEEIQQEEVPDTIEPSSVVEAQLDSNSGNDTADLQCPTFDSFQIANRGSEKKGKQITEENLQDALEEIRSGQDALVTCKKFSIPSIILYKGMKQSILEDALKSGQSIISASEKYKTALSILEEKLKKIVAKKRYTDENLLDALKGIQNGLCVNASSEKYNVPAGTLRDWKIRLNLESLASNPTHKNQENVDTENNSASNEIEGDDDDIPDFSQPITEQETNVDQSEAQISNEIQVSDTSPTLESGNTAFTKRGKQHSWTEEDILEALNDIKNGKSVAASSNKYNIPPTTLRDRMKKNNIKSAFTSHLETDQSTSTEPNPAQQQNISEDQDLAETEGLSPFLNPIERTPMSSPFRYEDTPELVETCPDIKDEQLEETLEVSLIADMILTDSNDTKLETEEITATGEDSESQDLNSRKSDSGLETPISNEIQGSSPSLESTNTAPIRKYKSWTEEDILEALNDIKNGQSLVASSKKYNIPTSTLGERMKKNNIKSTFINKIVTSNKYTKEDMLEALNDIKNGKSIVATSKKYNIPTSTLGEKMKKNNIKSAFIFTTKKYTEKDMLEALNDIKNGQSILESSKKYNIPNSTLRDRLKKPVEDSGSHETTNQNAIEGLDEGDSEISFNLSPEARKIHSSVRIDRRLADRVMYLTNNGIQVQYNQVDDLKVQGN